MPVKKKCLAGVVARQSKLFYEPRVAISAQLAAAFAVVPILIMGLYLWMAKRKGAFDAL